MALIVFGIVVLAVVGLAIWFRADRQRREARKAVEQLQSGRGEEMLAAMSNLVAAGDAGYAELARGLRAEESSFGREYDKWRQRLPADLRDLFPPRPARDEIRRAIGRSSALIGLAGARALVPAVEYAMDDSDPITSVNLLRTLYWSIPESPRAIRILSNYVAKPSPQKLLFGMWNAAEVWSAVPHLAPLMAPWLELSDQAGEAAEALGAMGTNGTFAAEAIGQVAKYGVAGNPPTFAPKMIYRPEDDQKGRNRCHALVALGQVGATNESALHAFEAGISDPDPLVRCSAADGLGFLGPRALPVLPYLMAHMDRSNRLVLRYQIEAIGKMGSGAASAVPVLVEFSEKPAVDQVPEPPEPNRMVRRSSEPVHLPWGAALSLALVAPEQARAKMEAVTIALSMPMLPQEPVFQLTPLKGDLLKVAGPQLSASKPDDMFAGALAGKIVLLAPEFAPARKLLEKQLGTAREPSRSRALLSYFRASHNTNKVTAGFERALADGNQTTIQLTEELGPAGKPLAPILLKYLEGPNYGLRYAAGRALRKIAPELLPQVKEVD